MHFRFRNISPRKCFLIIWQRIFLKLKINKPKIKQLLCRVCVCCAHTEWKHSRLEYNSLQEIPARDYFVNFSFPFTFGLPEFFFSLIFFLLHFADFHVQINWKISLVMSTHFCILIEKYLSNESKKFMFTTQLQFHFAFNAFVYINESCDPMFRRHHRPKTVCDWINDSDAYIESIMSSSKLNLSLWSIWMPRVMNITLSVCEIQKFSLL